MNSVILTLLGVLPRIVLILVDMARDRRLMSAGEAQAIATMARIIDDKVTKAAAARHNAERKFDDGGLPSDDPYRRD